MSPSPARQPPVITTTRVSYALDSAEPNGPAKRTQKAAARDGGLLTTFHPI